MPDGRFWKCHACHGEMADPDYQLKRDVMAGVIQMTDRKSARQTALQQPPLARSTVVVNSTVAAPGQGAVRQQDILLFLKRLRGGNVQ